MTRHRNRPQLLPIGSMSEGTLKMDDLIAAYLEALEPLRLTRADRARVRSIRIDEDERIDREQNPDPNPSPFSSAAIAAATGGETDDDARCFDLEELQQIADMYAPQFCYVGAHEGDGAAIGVWPCFDAIDDAAHTGELLKTDEVPSPGAVPLPPDGPEYWLHINDHGNCTLYRRAGRRWLQCWSIV